MQTQTHTTREATRTTLTIGSLALRLLNRLAEMDARYRDRCRMAELSDEALRDVGLTRAELDRNRRGG